MGYALLDRLKCVEDYSESKDIAWYKGQGDFFLAVPGTFFILYPHDAHMPGLLVTERELVRKVVVKAPV